MRILITGILAAIMLTSALACFGAGDDAASESSQTPDIDATVRAAVAKALAEETKRNESTVPPHMTTTPSSSSGQTNWLDNLSQFHRIKVARDEVVCVGYDYGRYFNRSHPIIKIDDGFYAIGNPGEAVVFYDENSGCRIGVITDESLE